MIISHPFKVNQRFKSQRSNKHQIWYALGSTSKWSGVIRIFYVTYSFIKSLVLFGIVFGIGDLVMAFRTVILGAPASGKGTISSRIVKAFGLEHLASGDKLRVNIAQNTPIGKEAKTYIDKGLLVPDDVMVKFIANELRQLKGNTWLLDGFPRTIGQAKSLWEVQKLDVVLNLIVPFEVIIDRVKGRWVHLPSGRVYNNDFNAPMVPGKDDITGEDLVQREDDNPSVVLKRLEQYEELTRPVVDFYKDKGILREFEGRTSDEIWPKVKSALSQFLPEMNVARL